MRRKQSEGLPAEVERVRVRFEELRGRRRHGQRIPEELWSAAAKVARGHGLNCVSQALGLDYSHLKKRIGVASEKEERAEDAFVELHAMGSDVSDRSCVVELEKGNVRLPGFGGHGRGLISLCSPLLFPPPFMGPTVASPGAKRPGADRPRPLLRRLCSGHCNSLAFLLCVGLIVPLHLDLAGRQPGQARVYPSGIVERLDVGEQFGPGRRSARV